MSACHGKVRYRTKGQAKDAAKRSRATFTDGATMRSYPCKLCSGYHLTSMTPDEHRAITRSQRRAT